MRRGAVRCERSRHSQYRLLHGMWAQQRARGTYGGVRALPFHPGANSPVASIDVAAAAAASSTHARWLHWLHDAAGFANIGSCGVSELQVGVWLCSERWRPLLRLLDAFCAKRSANVLLRFCDANCSRQDKTSQGKESPAQANGGYVWEHPAARGRRSSRRRGLPHEETAGSKRRRGLL